jgi:hypothetical protein
MVIAERLDEYGKGAWIAATVLLFWLAWPLALAMLVFLAGSGRMRAWKMEARGRWHNTGGCGFGGGWGRDGSGRRGSSGNVAFDEYRRETLRRLEDEQKEFEEYLDRLRAAKDKSEFDQFMADRRGGNGGAVTA